jgi:hypothetical protein
VTTVGSSHRTAPAATHPAPPRHAAEHASGKTTTPPNTTKIIYRPAGTLKRPPEITRWIEAKSLIEAMGSDVP